MLQHMQTPRTIERLQHVPGPWFIQGPNFVSRFHVARVWSSGFYQIKSDSRVVTKGEAMKICARLNAI